MLVPTLIARTTLLSPSAIRCLPLPPPSPPVSRSHPLIPAFAYRFPFHAAPVPLLVLFPWVIPIFLRRCPFSRPLYYVNIIFKRRGSGTVRRIPSCRGQWPRNTPPAGVGFVKYRKRAQTGATNGTGTGKLCEERLAISRSEHDSFLAERRIWPRARFRPILTRTSLFSFFFFPRSCNCNGRLFSPSTSPFSPLSIPRFFFDFFRYSMSSHQLTQ